jgi:hypothetical protein
VVKHSHGHCDNFGNAVSPGHGVIPLWLLLLLLLMPHAPVGFDVATWNVGISKDN